jgi:hypothetical protein
VSDGGGRVNIDGGEAGGVDKLLLFVAWSLMKSFHMWSA